MIVQRVHAIPTDNARRKSLDRRQRVHHTRLRVVSNVYSYAAVVQQLLSVKYLNQNQMNCNVKKKKIKNKIIWKLSNPEAFVNVITFGFYGPWSSRPVAV